MYYTFIVNNGFSCLVNLAYRLRVAVVPFCCLLLSLHILLWSLWAVLCNCGLSLVYIKIGKNR